MMVCGCKLFEFLTWALAKASISSAFAATTGVNAAIAANAAAFLKMLLLESSATLLVAASAVAERGFDLIVVVKASEEDIATRKRAERIRKAGMFFRATVDFVQV